MEEGVHDMKFPHAQKGVKKIFTAQILSLIATVIGIAAIIIALVGFRKGPVETDLQDALVLLSLLIGAVDGVVVLVSLILNLVGVIQAKKNEAYFGKALICTIIALIAMACFVGITSFARAGSIMKITSLTRIGGIMDLIADLANACAIIFTVVGIQMLSDELARADIRNLGRFICRLLCWTYTVMLLANVASLIFAYLPDVVLLGEWIMFAAELLKTAAFVVYLIFLGKAVKMLRA